MKHQTNIKSIKKSSLLSYLQIEGPYTLKHYLAMVGPDVISVSSNPQAQKILKRVEREATHRYQTLTLPEDGASNLFIVNGTLIHRCKSEAPKSDAVSIIFLETNGFLKTLP